VVVVDVQRSKIHQTACLPLASFEKISGIFQSSFSSRLEAWRDGASSYHPVLKCQMEDCNHISHNLTLSDSSMTAVKIQASKNPSSENKKFCSNILQRKLVASELQEQQHLPSVHFKIITEVTLKAKRFQTQNKYREHEKLIDSKCISTVIALIKNSEFA
jgi:hypothetical protein